MACCLYVALLNMGFCESNLFLSMSAYDIQKILRDTEQKYVFKNYLNDLVNLYTKVSFETESGYKKFNEEKKSALKEEIDLVSDYISTLEESTYYMTS